MKLSRLSVRRMPGFEDSGFPLEDLRERNEINAQTS
jgi:hypothetical protein